MDRMMLEVLTRIADNLFLIRETLECMLPQPPEDDDEDEEAPGTDGMTFYECDSFCNTCKHWGKWRWEFPCNDCKHVTEKKQTDRYTPRGGQNGADGNG